VFQKAIMPSVQNIHQMTVSMAAGSPVWHLKKSNLKYDMHPSPLLKATCIQTAWSFRAANTAEYIYISMNMLFNFTVLYLIPSLISANSFPKSDYS
jgi:hypothetical protein